MGIAAAAIVAAGTVAAAGVSAYSSSKNAKDAAKGRKASANSAVGALSETPDSDSFRKAYGTVPKAALYKPVDFDAEQLAAIEANMAAQPDLEKMMRKTNAGISRDALDRINKLFPGYSQAMRSYATSASDLLEGRLPFDDALGVVQDSSALGAAMGTPGASYPTTLRDLGLSRLQALQMGGGMMGDIARIAETVSPRSTYIGPGAFLQSTGDRITNRMVQNQTIQQSRQNANNLAAAGDPALRAQLEFENARQNNIASILAGVAPSAGGDPTSAAIAAGIQGIGQGVASYAANRQSTGSGLDTTYAGSPGNYGSTYVGQYNGKPVYRPATA